MQMVLTLTPQLQAHYDNELKRVLDPNGMPLHPGNDYELHMYARRLRNLGKTKEEVKRAVIALAGDIPERKRASYVNDVVNSILVGFEGGNLPIIMPAGVNV